MMHFAERIMTAERCMNITSYFTYRKIDEAVMTKMLSRRHARTHACAAANPFHGVPGMQLKVDQGLLN